MKYNWAVPLQIVLDSFFRRSNPNPSPPKNPHRTWLPQLPIISSC